MKGPARKRKTHWNHSNPAAQGHPAAVFGICHADEKWFPR